MATDLKRRASSAEEPRKPARGERARLPLTVSRPELLVNGSDRDFRHLVHAFFGFLARHEKIRDGHAHVIGLAGTEYTVLISIAHLAADGDVNIKTVADHLHVSGAFITSIARRLLQGGLIHKRTDPSDRRKVALTVSAKGHALIERLAPVQRRVNDVEFGCLSREDFRALIDTIDRLIASGDRAVALQTYLHSDRREGDEA